MTEAEWLACEDPLLMLFALTKKARDRKFRLFALACCRLRTDLGTPEDEYDRCEREGCGRDDSQWACDWAVADLDRGLCVPLKCAMVRCIFGSPFRPVTVDPIWGTGNVVALAQAIYQERAFERLPILADALEDAGCTDADVLGHCRGGGEHVRGCWVVDLVLGKE